MTSSLKASEESNVLVPSAQEVDERSADEESNLCVPAAQVDEESESESCIKILSNLLVPADESQSCVKALLCNEHAVASESYIKVTGNNETLRKIDLNGDGEITFDEVLAFARHFESSEKSGKFYRNLALCLVIAVLMLTASNVGTSMLAIALSKEIKIASDGTLESVAGSKALKIEAKAHSIVALPDLNGMGRRRLEDWEAELYGTGNHREFLGCVSSLDIFNTIFPGSTASVITVDMEGGTTKTKINPYDVYLPQDFGETIAERNLGGVVAQIYDDQANYTMIAPDSSNPNDLCAHLNNVMNGFDELQFDELQDDVDDFRKLLPAARPEFRRHLQSRGRYSIYAAYQNAYNKFTAFFG